MIAVCFSRGGSGEGLGALFFCTDDDGNGISKLKRLARLFMMILFY